MKHAMSEKKRCIRCQRPIDAYARICPYCNWDQADPAVPRDEQPVESTYTPPRENNWRKYALMAGGGIVLLLASFALGSMIQGKKPVKGVDQAGTKTSAATGKAPLRPSPHADVTLVPLSGSDNAAFEAPITSAPVAAPAEGVPSEYQRSDATAVSSVEYAQLAARAQAEKKKQKELIDPRTLTGPAYAQGAASSPSQAQTSASPEPSPAAASSSRSEEPSPTTQPEPARSTVSTRPVPEYQPIPDVSVQQTTVVRLELTVGADGRVKEVNVLQGIPGQTSKIISTVQTWRFKPATENGNPVSAPFSVDLSFRGNE
jgi:periplasmic protein TonB